MKKLFLLAVVFLSVAAMAQQITVEDLAKSIGATDLATLQYSGDGVGYRFGQSLNPKAAWPQYPINAYTRVIDFKSVSSSEEFNRVIPNQPVHATEFVSGQCAWNATDTATTPAFAQADDRAIQIWLTPQGFLKAALANQATAKLQDDHGNKVVVISFTAHDKKFVGYASVQGFLYRTQTWIDNPLLGSTLIETDYSEYKDFGGLKFPTKIVQKQGGFPTLDLVVNDVKPGVVVAFKVPDVVQQAKISPVHVETQKVADGIWYLTGGTHHSVVVEFKDYVAVIEAPLNEERSKAVIAEAKQLVPNKPLRYLINTHHHFDHSGGLRLYAAQGVTIVTHEINKPYYASLFKANIETVSDKKILTDGSRLLELHLIKDSPHAEGLLLAYLPKEKILVEADAFTPLAPNAPKPAAVNPATVNLYKNIEALHLDVATILPIHGRLVPYSDLVAAAGISNTTQTASGGN